MRPKAVLFFSASVHFNGEQKVFQSSCESSLTLKLCATNPGERVWTRASLIVNPNKLWIPNKEQKRAFQKKKNRRERSKKRNAILAIYQPSIAERSRLAPITRSRQWREEVCWAFAELCVVNYPFELVRVCLAAWCSPLFRLAIAKRDAKFKGNRARWFTFVSSQQATAVSSLSIRVSPLDGPISSNEFELNSSATPRTCRAEQRSSESKIIPHNSHPPW